MSDRRNLFIIGSPKSGTTWLQIMIGAHPRVCTTVELTLFSKYTAPWIETWNRQTANIDKGRWDQGLPFLWDEDEFYGFLRMFVDKVHAGVLATNPHATHILDKHPGYNRYVDDINRLIPDARFIHIIRDGRDVAASMVAARRRIGYGTGTVPASAAAWKEHVLAAQEARKYCGRYMEVRYEDILAFGLPTLASVFDFCELPISEEEVAEIVEAHRFQKMKAKRQHADDRAKTHQAFYRKGKAGSWREDLDAFDRYRFDRIAGDLLVELGYAQEGWWAESRYERVMLPAFCRLSAAGSRIGRAIRALAGS